MGRKKNSTEKWSNYYIKRENDRCLASVEGGASPDQVEIFGLHLCICNAVDVLMRGGSLTFSVAVVVVVVDRDC
jgi:hypothetical protein